MWMARHSPWTTDTDMRLYRVDYTCTSNGPQCCMNSFMVVKETPCGYWIEVYGEGKWVSATARKRYAYPTKEEAINGWRARKHRHLAILHQKIHEIRRALEVDPARYWDYEHRSSFRFPDRGERKEFKDAVLDFVDTSDLPMRYYEPYHR
jgi:hypothetical protein